MYAGLSALSNNDFDRMKNKFTEHPPEGNIQAISHTTIAVDIGFSKSEKQTCGIAYRGPNIDPGSCTLNFADAIDKTEELLVKALKYEEGSPLLIVEAPLSKFFKDGCPYFRGKFEQEVEQVFPEEQPKYWKGRGWYYGSGASVALGAIHFLEGIAAKICIPSINNPKVLLAEAFLSGKSGKTKHEDDAKTILEQYWIGSTAELEKDCIPICPLISEVPCVRVFASP